MSNVSSNRPRLNPVPNRPVSLRAAQAWCRRFARSHRENFIFATLFLPRRLRQPFYNVYAFCRFADDLADESGSTELAIDQLQEFQRRLESAFTGEPKCEIFVALADTVDQFALPQLPFDQLLQAFRQDQSTFRYQSRGELLAYCQKSANPVGEIMLRLCDGYSTANKQLSDDICTGLQLVNFWQDVKRDFAIGRIYLPLETMTKFDVREEMFAEVSTPPALRCAIRDECRLAREHLLRGFPLAQRVPVWFARDVQLFAHAGLAVIDAIEQIDFDVLRVRPVVSRKQRLAMLTKAFLRRL